MKKNQSQIREECIALKLSIDNKFGLHGRAAAKLVETAMAFDSQIKLVRDDCEVDCKSILDVMTTACTQGTNVILKAEGCDAKEALQALQELFQKKFGEE